jgi:hypothetical protein
VDHTPSHSQPARPTVLWLWTVHLITAQRIRKPLGKYANKQDMVDLLQENGCLADVSMGKTVLFYCLAAIGLVWLLSSTYINELNFNSAVIMTLPSCKSELLLMSISMRGPALKKCLVHANWNFMKT